MIYKKSHDQPENLSFYHERGNIWVFPKNQRISGNICLLNLILQGGIVFFAVFSSKFVISQKIARNEKKSVSLPDLKQDLGFSEKSLIFTNDLMWFYEGIHDRMFSNKSNILIFELMSIKCVKIIYYILRKIEYSKFRINVY